MRILWIPHTGWHIPQRAHIFCNIFAEHHEIHVTDWVADFATPRDYLSKRYLQNFSYRQYQDGLIQVHGIPRISPAIYSLLLRRLNTLLFKHYVDLIVKHQHIDVVIGTFLVPPPQAPRLVFDLFDENVINWRNGAYSPAYAEEIDRIERDYMQKADAVVAASTVLADKARRLGTHGPVYFIPNGVDLHSFDTANRERFRQMLDLHGKVIGMVGNHDDPTEVNKVLEVAKLLDAPEYCFLIAGRGLAVEAARRRVQHEGLRNVRFHGYIHPAQIPDMLAAIDIGLCPYPKTPMDDARSPLRLFAYAAAGLPTVCTDLLEVRRLQFPTVILVDDTPQALADGIRSALCLPRARPSQIERFDIKRLAKQYEAVLMGELHP